MRKLLISISIVILFFGCTKNNVQRANDLLQKHSSEYGSVTKLDSVFGYQESFDNLQKAAKFKHDADSILQMKVSSLKEMKRKGMIDAMDRTARMTQKTILNMYNAAYEYDKEAISVDFEKKIKGIPKTFLGYKYISQNDSCTYVIYYDKDITKILFIDKKLRTKEN